MLAAALAAISAVAVTSIGVAHAGEEWTCSFASAGQAPMLVTYIVSHRELIEKFPTGIIAHFRLAEDNQYGIVGISTIAAMEPNQATATVGFDTIAIDARTKEAWHATAVSGQPAAANEMMRGTCIKN